MTSASIEISRLAPHRICEALQYREPTAIGVEYEESWRIALVELWNGWNLPEAVSQESVTVGWFNVEVREGKGIRGQVKERGMRRREIGRNRGRGNTRQGKLRVGS